MYNSSLQDDDRRIGERGEVRNTQIDRTFIKDFSAIS